MSKATTASTWYAILFCWGIFTKLIFRMNQLFIFLKGQSVWRATIFFNQFQYELVLQVSQQSGLWYQKFVEASLSFYSQLKGILFQSLAYKRAPANFCGSTSGSQLDGSHSHPRCLCTRYWQGDSGSRFRRYLQQEQAHSRPGRRLPYLLRWYAWRRRDLPCFLRRVW